ncbi:MAG: hypothetical protein LUC99_08130, partial [Clostridiales bacterium]|nr:hypothetical protein [Clostridiales bacterium]
HRVKGETPWRVEGGRPRRVKGEAPCPHRIDACVNPYWVVSVAKRLRISGLLRRFQQHRCPAFLKKMNQDCTDPAKIS